MVRKLHAALVGAAVSVLALTGVAPAGAATRAGGPAVTVTASGPGSGPEAITADPATGRPGGSVDLRTFADCGGTQSGSVVSPAFAAPVSLGLAADGGLFAQAEVATGTASGAYPVRELCQGRTVAVGTLAVVGMTAPDTGGGWGATHAVAVALGGGGSDGDSDGGTDGLGGVRGRASLVLIGAAALGGLVRLGRRSHG